MAGLIRAALALHHRILPPTRNGGVAQTRKLPRADWSSSPRPVPGSTAIRQNPAPRRGQRIRVRGDQCPCRARGTCRLGRRHCARGASGLGYRGLSAVGRRSGQPCRPGPLAPRAIERAAHATPSRTSRSRSTADSPWTGRSDSAGHRGRLAGRAGSDTWQRSSQGCETAPAARFGMPTASTTGQQPLGRERRAPGVPFPGRRFAVSRHAGRSLPPFPRAPHGARHGRPDRTRIRRGSTSEQASVWRDGFDPRGTVGDRHGGHRRALVAVGHLPGADAAGAAPGRRLRTQQRRTARNRGRGGAARPSGRSSGS